MDNSTTTAILVTCKEHWYPYNYIILFRIIYPDVCIRRMINKMHICWVIISRQSNIKLVQAAYNEFNNNVNIDYSYSS